MRRNEWLEKEKCEAGVFTAVDQRESCGTFLGPLFSCPEPYQRDTVHAPAPEKAHLGHEE